MRGEVLNVGILAERDGEFIVRSGSHVEKTRAITAALDPDEIRAELHELPKILAACDSDQVASCLRANSFLHADYKGVIQPGNPMLLDHYLDDLVHRYVNPEPAPAKPIRKKSSRLRNELRDALRAEKILARPTEGLESHRVLYRHALSEGVVADFVLQNGAMHVVETVDATSDVISVHRSIMEIALSALTFEHARMRFNNSPVKPRLVYNVSATMEKAIEPSLAAARNQGAELVNWASFDERNKLLTTLASLANRSGKNEDQGALFNSSILPRTKLN
jgi:hypothetical protein